MATIAINKTLELGRAALFILANIALPHFFHLFPGGGIMFLPIYFFTAVAAVRHGYRMGILTAIMSPITGYLIFGAPHAALIPDMVLKGTLLSVCIAYALLKARTKREQFIGIPLAVIAAWGIAGLLELPVMPEYLMAFQDFHTGIPGMIMMTVAGWLALLIKKRVAS